MPVRTTVKNGKRPCSDCGLIKPLGSFSMRTGQKWTTTVCKPCMSLRKKKYYRANIVFLKAYAAEYQRKYRKSKHLTGG